MPPAGRDSVWLKGEFLQHCGVFKTRGAFNRQLAALETSEIGDVGIVVASGGNAGLAHAFVARELGVRATVLVPEIAPEVKVELISSYGADVRRAGTEYAEAYQAAVEFGNESGAAFAHAYDQFEVAAGAGTLCEEIFEDEPSIDTVIVAVGGGGLYAGVAASAQALRRVPRNTSASPASATIGPTTAHRVCPDMALPPMTPRPCNIQTSPIATSSSPTTMRTGDLFMSRVSHHSQV
ncbi:pyridoxal-phosphate dependent enzyme [Monashia sp. NPDC004114]